MYSAPFCWSMTQTYDWHEERGLNASAKDIDPCQRQSPRRLRWIDTFFYKVNFPRAQRPFLSHENPCFQCNIAITNFLVSNTWRHGSKHCIYVFLRKNSKTWLAYMAKWVYFGPLFFKFIRLIQLCDKNNLTFVDCWDKIILNSSWKMLLSSPKARLITSSKTRLI